MRSSRLFIALGILLLCFGPGFAQTGDGPMPWPAHNKIDPSVSVMVTHDFALDKVRYTYAVKSQSTSEQDIYSFDLLLETEPDEIDWPEKWVGIFLSDFSVPNPPRVGWVTSLHEDFIAPGESLAGFIVSAPRLPGIVESQSEGWAALINIDEVPPERLPVGLIPDETAYVAVKTVGPVFPLETAEANPAALGAHLVSQATMAQELGWLNASLQLPSKLQDLQSALASGNNALSATRVAGLQAFLAQQQGQGITSDGHALLQASLAFLAVKFPPPQPTVQTLRVSVDGLIYEKSPHANEGANPRLTLEKINGKAARNLLNFDISGANIQSLTKATLVFTIDPTEQVTGWGNGELVSLKPLNVAWAEGNGRRYGLSGSTTPGSGSGATWSSSIDANIANDSANSTTNWAGGASAIMNGATPSQTIRNHQSGELRFDVTVDVKNGVPNGWLLRKDAENKGSKVSFYSREGAAAAGAPDLAPRLILEFGGITTQVPAKSWFAILLDLMEQGYRQLQACRNIPVSALSWMGRTPG